MRLDMLKQLIIEGYKEATSEFTKVDPNASEVIKQYRDLVNRNQVQGDERNIDYWRKQGYEKFKEFVSFRSQIPSNKQVKKASQKGKQITLAENDKWLVVVPLDKDASCFYGKNTEWCTTKPFQSYYEQYFFEDKVTLIYCIRKRDMEKWAIAVYPDEIDNVQFFNRKDDEISQEDFDNETGIISKNFIAMVKEKEISSATQRERNSYKEFQNKITESIKNMKPGERDPHIEQMLIKSPNHMDAWLYFNMAGRHDYPERLVILILNNRFDIIKFVKNQTHKMQMIQAENFPFSLEHMANPSDEVLMVVAKKQVSLISQFISDFPERKIPLEVYKTCIQTNAYFITNKTVYQSVPEEWLPELRLLAIQNKASLVDSLPNPSLDEYVMAIENSNTNIYKDLPEELQSNQKIIDAVTRNTGLELHNMVKSILDNGITLSNEQLLNMAKNLGENNLHNRLGKVMGILHFFGDGKYEKILPKMMKVSGAYK